jgi:predicted nuclease of predicted toxin-antitoxin system
LTVRFLVDAQLPPALARQLSSLGHQADHVAEVGLLTASDPEIWQFASANGAAIVTKDADFVTLRALRSQGPAVVWIRIGNTTTRELLARLAATLPKIVEALDKGEHVVEVADA